MGILFMPIAQQVFFITLEKDEPAFNTDLTNAISVAVFGVSNSDPAEATLQLHWVPHGTSVCIDQLGPQYLQKLQLHA